MGKEVYVIYHGGCMDGFGAAYAAWKFLGDTAEYIPVKYGEPFPDLMPNSIVFVIDVSFERDIVEQAIRTHEKFVLLDHHVTAQRKLDGIEGVNINLDKSGAMLAWEYFHGDTPVPSLLSYIQDNDLWKFELEETRAVIGYLHTIPRQFEVWEQAANDLDGEEDIRMSIIDQGWAIVAYDQTLIKMISNSARLTTDLFGNKVVEVNSTSHWSEVGNKLLNKFKEASYSKVYHYTSDGSMKCSLRSRGDFDVSKIAEYYGGGGHKGAAGYIFKVN